MNTKDVVIGLAVVVVLAVVWILWAVKVKDKPSAREVELEERIKYLESENYKDSLYRVDTVEKRIILTNERIIHNTKIYEKIIHKYDTATATEHERYYANRYRKDTASDLR